MDLSKIIRADRVDLNISAKNKDDAIKSLAHLLYESGALYDEQKYLEDVFEREKVSATGIGNGIAIPHGKSVAVKETSAAIGRVCENLNWESTDDEPIKFIVLLAVNDSDKNTSHVKLLSQMARKLASNEVCKRLISAKTREEIVEIFSE